MLQNYQDERIRTAENDGRRYVQRILRREPGVPRKMRNCAKLFPILVNSTPASLFFVSKFDFEHYFHIRCVYMIVLTTCLAGLKWLRWLEPGTQIVCTSLVLSKHVANSTECRIECAKRWNHSLDPKLDHSKWTPELDELLVSAIAAYGRVWKTIGEKNFPSRSATDLKNRYLIVARRQKLQNASLSTQSTPSLSPSNSPSATHKTAKMAHGASPTSTLGMDHSDDEYERIDSRTIGPSNPLIADFSSTEQMWLSSPDTPGSCEFTFTCLPSVDTPSSENSASAGSISFPFPDVGTDEKFNPTVNAFEGSSIMGKLEPYDGWEPPSVCNSHLRPNCLPSSALVKTDDYHTNSTNTAPHSPLLSYSPNLFSYNETVAMPPNADPFSDETDFIFTDHNSLGWQEQHHNEMHVNMHGIESGMDMNFDFLGEEEGENITRMGLEHSTDSGLMEDGSDMKDGRMEIPLNTMILEDVHPDMVRDLMGVLLRSKERVKMRMYSQE